ncbi:MAG: peptidase M20, partial [Saprospiraceae bacterium]|nr:peptidase M20 [Saprospiraceae bacterium]
VEDHPDYHKPTDDYEKINEDFFIEVVKLIIETVKIADLEID